MSSKAAAIDDHVGRCSGDRKGALALAADDLVTEQGDRFTVDVKRWVAFDDGAAMTGAVTEDDEG